MTASAPLSRAEQLRQEFDRSFMEPIVQGQVETHAFIGLRLGGEPYAIRLGEIGGLHGHAVIVPCPTPLPELMGLAGFRGALVPVYDLAALLGHPPSAGRWLALAADRALAYAFDDFDSQFRVLPEAIHADQRPKARAHTNSTVRHGEGLWPIIDLPTLFATIRDRAQSAAPAKG
jgi:purine-binding chemotaxis protein CheW